MHKDAQREYMILNAVLPGARGRSLLGSVIYHSHHTRPDDDHVPDRSNLNDEERAQVEKLFEKVWDTPAGYVGLEDLVRYQRETRSGQASTEIARLFNGWIGGMKGQSYMVTAGQTKRYSIPNVGQELKNRYLKCEPWWREVKQHYERADPGKKAVLFLISGVWLCSDMVAQEINTSSKGGGMAMNLAAGQPNAPSVNAKAEANKDRANVRGERIPGEVVFAIKCHRLDLIHKDVSPGSVGWWPWTQKLPARETLVGLRLGLPVPGSANAYAGGTLQNESDEETNPELRYFYIADPAFASIADIQEDVTDARTNGQAQ